MYHSFIHSANIWWEPTLCQILLLVLQHSYVQRRQNPNYVLLIIQQLAGVGGGKRTYLHELFIYIMYIFLSWQIYQPNITELRAGKRCARSTLVSLVSLWELTAHHWKTSMPKRKRYSSREKQHASHIYQKLSWRGQNRKTKRLGRKCEIGSVE